MTTSPLLAGLRPVVPKDHYPGLAALWTTYAPEEPTNAEMLLDEDQMRPQDLRFAEWIAGPDDAPHVAILINQPWWLEEPGLVDWAVPHQRPNTDLFEAGRAFAEAEAARWEGSTTLQTYSKNNWDEINPLLSAAGYTVVERTPHSALDLAAWDPSAWNAALESCTLQGITLTSAAQLEAQGIDWIPKLHAMTWEAIQDMPQAGAPRPIALEDYTRQLRTGRIYDYHLMTLALDGDQVVGYSRTTRNAVQPNWAETGLTGTLRAYRNRGIATALKVANLTALKERGVTQVITTNEETNNMLNINQRLGFRVTFEWWLWRRMLSGEPLAPTAAPAAAPTGTAEPKA